jgi:tetratricopeptide (TPR) repeat protein
MATVTLERYLEELAGRGVVDPEGTGKSFQELLTRFPDNKSVFEQYAWYLYEIGDFQGAIEYSRKAIEIDASMFAPRFNLCFTYAKLGKYDDAIQEFIQLFAVTNPAYYPDSPYMYFNFLLVLANGFDYEKSAKALGTILANHPELKENGTDAYLKSLSENRIKQIYKLNNNISGFLLFIDLVSSTQYKHDFPELWQERIIHFLMYTKYSLKYPGFDFIKFIGDEVMMFRPFDGKKTKGQVAKDIFTFLCSRQNQYLSEVNRFNPSLRGEEFQADSPHRIRVKIALGEVTNAKLIFPYYDEIYDLIGEDVDRVARIKELGYENLIIADEGFVNALSENGPGFDSVFSDMVWQQKFKGIKERIKFYGRIVET